MQRAVTIVDPSLSQRWFDQATKPLVEESAHYAGIGVRAARREFPVLIAGLQWRSAGKEMLLHVQADNYDYLPPRGWWVDEGGAPLRAGRAPAGGGLQQPPNPYGEEKSWLCFPGWREYHDHHSHQGNSWAPLRAREEYGIAALLVQLLHDLNRPEVRAQ